MGTAWILIALLIWLVISWLVAKQFAEVAEMKKHDDGKYFWICFFLGVVGYLLVIALPDRGRQEVRMEQPAPTRQQPVVENVLPRL